MNSGDVLCLMMIIVMCSGLISLFVSFIIEKFYNTKFDLASIIIIVIIIIGFAISLSLGCILI